MTAIKVRTLQRGERSCIAGKRLNDPAVRNAAIASRASAPSAAVLYRKQKTTDRLRRSARGSFTVSDKNQMAKLPAQGRQQAAAAAAAKAAVRETGSRWKACAMCTRTGRRDATAPPVCVHATTLVDCVLFTRLQLQRLCLSQHQQRRWRRFHRFGSAKTLHPS